MKLPLPTITVVVTTNPFWSTTPTSTSPLITPRIELKKRAEACGDLQGAYPNAVPPTCAGSASICTFTAGYQGCCDDSDNCTFYTSCQGGLVPASSRCSDAGCLQCPSAVPYCTQYNFREGVSAYEGFACGTIYIADLVVQGTVGTQVLETDSAAPSSSVQSSSSPFSPSSSLPSSTSTTSSASSFSSSSTVSPSRSTTTSSTSTFTSATGSVQADPTTSSKTSVAVIAGSAVGAGVFVIAVIVAICCCWRRSKRRKHLGSLPQPEQSTRY